MGIAINCGSVRQDGSKIDKKRKNNGKKEKSFKTIYLF